MLLVRQDTIQKREFRSAIEQLVPSLFAYKLAETRLAYGRFLVGRGRYADAKRELGAGREYYHDPLAAPRRAEIDALLAQCEVRA